MMKKLLMIGAATAKATALLLAFGCAFGAWAVPSVTITSVQQDYPAGNTVTVKYTVADGVSDGEGYAVKFYATINNKVSEVTVSPSENLLATGSHAITWTAADNLLDTEAGFAAKVVETGASTDPETVAELKDYCDRTFAKKDDLVGMVTSENFGKYIVCYEMENAFHAPAGSFSPDYANQQYMIVNLSSGFVAYCDSSDTVTTNFFNQTAAKGQYMVFSRVPAGSYAMRIGADMTEPKDANATGVIAKDYYIAIFECTAAQYSYIVNDTASTTYTPKNYISWNAIRDSAAVGSAVPNSGSGVIAKLNSRVQSKMADSTIYFDLPTETMWQIAAQASGDPRYLRFYGAGTGDLSKYAVVQTGTSASALANAGSKVPNQWCIYDMYGNAWEWCLDATTHVSWNNNVQNSAEDHSLSQSPQTTGASRVIRGGGANSADDLAWSRSGSRYRNFTPTGTYWNVGFRLARIVRR